MLNFRPLQQRYMRNAEVIVLASIRSLPKISFMLIAYVQSISETRVGVLPCAT